MIAKATLIENKREKALKTDEALTSAMAAPEKRVRKSTEAPVAPPPPNKKLRKPAEAPTVPKATRIRNSSKSTAEPPDIDSAWDEEEPPPAKRPCGRPAGPHTIRGTARRSARAAIVFLKQTFTNESAPWIVRLRAASELLAQCRMPSAPAGLSKAKADKPKPQVATDIAAQCREAMRDIEGVMLSHANATLDLAHTAPDPDRLLEQPAPVQHRAGGAAIG